MEMRDLNSTAERNGAIEGAERRPARVRSWLWGAAGMISFGAGALGAVLPLIPTTPFILLAAFCFARSSRRLNEWFRSTKLYETVFEGLLTRKAMTLSAKLKLLIPISVLLGVSFLLMESVPVGRIVVAAIFIGHVVYFGFMVKNEKVPRWNAQAQTALQED